jgi:hypothetical protein
MYELTAPPQMSSPYTPAGGSNMSTAPSLGSPAQQGFPATQNPAAQQLQSMGRGNDSMLIHMTPEEVNSLQGLAVASGGSLTINPQTGLPEAGWLGKLLPTLLGGLGMAFGIPPIWMGLGGAALGTAATGDLMKGLSMGLQAYGGASLAGAAGVTGAISKNALGLMGNAGSGMAQAGAATLAANPAPMVVGQQGVTNLGATAAQNIAKMPTALGGLGAAAPNTAIPLVAGAPGAMVGDVASQLAAGKTGIAGFMQGFGDSAKMGMPGGILGKAAPMLATTGVMSGLSEATAPQGSKYDPNADKEKSNYKGPYVPSRRQVSYPSRGYDPRNMDSSEYAYFTPSNPVPGFLPVSELPPEERAVYGMAKGGAASASKSRGLDDLAAYFQSSSPGAITASMYPTMPSTPTTPTTSAATNPTPSAAPTSEQTYNFGNANTGIGMGAGFAGGIINIPGIGPIDLSKVMARYASTTPASSTVPTSTTMPYDYRPYYGGGRGERNPTKNVAAGGKIDMDDGSFVMDARTVSELGNGSSNAGMELLSRMGGRPVNGPGDGVSDSVPARIGGRQEARVARDEVIFSSDAVRRVGGGSDKRGTQKLYALMDKAHKARKRAGRGTDTKLRRGLA